MFVNIYSVKKGDLRGNTNSKRLPEFYRYTSALASSIAYFVFFLFLQFVLTHMLS